RIASAAGELVELHPFQPELGAVLEFAHRVVHSRGREHADREKAIRRRRLVFFGQKLVVGANQLDIERVVFGLPQHERDLTEQDLRVDAVFILLAYALFGRAGAGAVFERGDLFGEVAVRHAHAAGDADRVGLAAVDDDGVRAV